MECIRLYKAAVKGLYQKSDEALFSRVDKDQQTMLHVLVASLYLILAYSD